MTPKQSSLVEFLRAHGPAKSLSRCFLRSADGSSYRITKTWVERYANDGLIARRIIRTPRGLPVVWYDLKEKIIPG